MTKLFPSILMLLDIGASIVYMTQGDFKHALYWISACMLTACVTF